MQLSWNIFFHQSLEHYCYIICHLSSEPLGSLLSSICNQVLNILLWWLSLLHYFYLNFNFKNLPFLPFSGLPARIFILHAAGSYIGISKTHEFFPTHSLVQSVVSQMCPGHSKCQVQNIRNFISVHLFSTLLIFISVYVLSSIT